MKLVAHRGGRNGPENTLEAFINAANSGADAVECDIRFTKDGIGVIFHDPDLKRLGGVDATIGELTLKEVQDALAAQGRTVLTFSALCEGYREKTPILLHVKKAEADPELVDLIADSGLPIIAGLVSLEALTAFAKRLPSERLLAFMPDPAQAEEFHRAGAGILRLWEQWLPNVTPAEIKAKCPGAEVFIMACSIPDDPSVVPLEAMDGSRDSLDYCLALGADGVLLNDLEMALNWRKNLTV